MCVIAAKAAGVKMPDDATLYRMWSNNPNGAGFMYARDNKVYIEKGFMTYKAFEDALNYLGEKYNLTSLPIVMHFRITTSGGTKPENCHPFPISSSLGKLKKRKLVTDIGVAHNGIIDITPRAGISDTMEYIATQLTPLMKGVPMFYKNKYLMEMIENATDSKLAFLTRNGKIYTVGKFEEENGVIYSNSSYSYFRNYKSFTWGQYDKDEYEMYTDRYDYTVVNVMWLKDGQYICDENGDLWDGEGYAIDEDMVVYTYADDDTIVPVLGAVAKDENDRWLNYDEESEYVTQEIAFTNLLPW